MLFELCTQSDKGKSLSAENVKIRHIDGSSPEPAKQSRDTGQWLTKLTLMYLIIII